MKRSTTNNTRQTGWATLALCAVLLLVLSAAAAWAVRALTAAQRVAANDLRAAQAAEAADGGLAWALALLNSPPVNADCQPDPDGTRLRQRLLTVDDQGALKSAKTAGSPALWGAGCMGDLAGSWRCQCDSLAHAALLAQAGQAAPGEGPAGSAGSGDAASPSPSPHNAPALFSIRLNAMEAPGQFRVHVRGCSAVHPDCDAPFGSTTGHPLGGSELSQHVALLSALRRPPAQAITARPDAFERTFALPAARYRAQPALWRGHCAADCDAVVQSAIRAGHRLLWLDGGAVLEARTLERPREDPLLLVVDGQLELTGGARGHGVLYARAGIRWAAGEASAPPGSAHAAATWQGALVTAGVWDPVGDVTVQHDAPLLMAMNQQMGSYLPVPGGWNGGR